MPSWKQQDWAECSVMTIKREIRTLTANKAELLGSFHYVRRQNKG